MEKTNENIDESLKKKQKLMCVEIKIYLFIHSFILGKKKSCGITHPFFILHCNYTNTRALEYNTTKQKTIDKDRSA